MPQIEVTFDLDANGILSVQAKDQASGKEQSIRIEGSGGLSSEEIDRMVRDAESHAGEDKQRREIIEKRNALDAMAYQAEKTLTENDEKLSDDEKQGVRTAIEAAGEKLESEDAAALDAARQQLEQSLHAVAEKLYKAQAAPGAEGAESAESSAPPDGDDVVVAEYTEEKDG